MKKAKRGRPVGSGKGLSDVRISLECTEELAKAVKASAKLLGISSNEWWRRAARDMLQTIEFIESRELGEK